MPVIITVLFGAKFSGSAIFSQVVLVSLGLYLLSNIHIGKTFLRKRAIYKLYI